MAYSTENRNIFQICRVGNKSRIRETVNLKITAILDLTNVTTAILFFHILIFTFGVLIKSSFLRNKIKCLSMVSNITNNEHKRNEFAKFKS